MKPIPSETIPKEASSYQKALPRSFKHILESFIVATDEPIPSETIPKEASSY